MPLAEHDSLCSFDGVNNSVSIHVPLAEHDIIVIDIAISLDVSIHVPLAEHDNIPINARFRVFSFNSRAPRGARPRTGSTARPLSSFNSRAPRGARLYAAFILPGRKISFNSRAPRGARLNRVERLQDT